MTARLYLHEECEQQVIHRDVKASNIMLDSEYNARLGDFSLARLIEHDWRPFIATGLVGTMGYIAPECVHTGRPAVESDVFSFGAGVLPRPCDLGKLVLMQSNDGGVVWESFENPTETSPPGLKIKTAK